MNNYQEYLDNLTKESFGSLASIEKIILDLGLNNEILHEQPPEYNDFYGKGFGFRIWQYPNQFSKYLKWLTSYATKINSYYEIGCRSGGTFILTTELIRKFNTGESFFSTACDLLEPNQLILDYLSKHKFVNYVRTDSHNKSFIEFMQTNKYDLILIDGDHNYDGVKQDSENTRNSANIQVFHDIVNDHCPGVVRYWKELKTELVDTHNFYEFTDQYNSVNGSFLGIGCVVKKEFDI
jgi:hypothetical protein